MLHPSALVAAFAGLATVAPSLAALSSQEANDLLFAREEEKMARDVYLVLHDLYGSAEFANIAASEQRHTDAVKRMLDFYALTDPVTDDTIGAFVNPALGDLYTSLITRGTASPAAAFLVGIDIEKIDIADLDNMLARTDEPNITTVYTNLQEGSRSHLQAFRTAYRNSEGCRADLDENGRLTMADVIIMLDAVATGDDSINLVPPDGPPTMADILDFIQAFTQGCSASGN